MRRDILTKAESETITARVPSDLAEGIERERERLGEAKSVAIRTILRRGLAADPKGGSDACAE